MDEKLAKLIKENNGVLRQLTYLNKEVKELKSKVKVLEQNSDYPNEKELEEIKVGGTD